MYTKKTTTYRQIKKHAHKEHERKGELRYFFAADALQTRVIYIGTTAEGS